MKRSLNNPTLQTFMDLNKLPLGEFIHELNSKSTHPDYIQFTCFDICKNWYKVEWDGNKYIAIK